MTEKQFEALIPFEHFFDTAVHNNYVRSVSMKDAKIMSQIHNKLTKQNVNLTCPKCVLDMCTTLGKLYFMYKNKI